MRLDELRTRVTLGAIVAAVLVVAGALATHLPYVLAADCLDSDAAVVVLMGRHFAHGEIAPFFWGQRYMGALEAWVLAPFAWFGSVPLVAACLAALGLTAVQAVCVARIADRAGGQVFVAVLLATTTGAMTAFAQTTLYGGRLAATTLALIALDAIQAKPRQRAVVAGLLTGLALYGDRLMLVWTIPIALAAYRARVLGRLAAAAIPWVVFERVCFVLTTGPRPGLAEPGELPRNIGLLLLDGAPMYLGAEWAGARCAPFVPPAHTMLWVLLSLGTAIAAVCALVVLGRRMRTTSIADLALVPLATAGIFVIGATDTQSVRYLAPAWPALAVLGSIAAARRPALGFAAAAVTAGNMILSVAYDAVHAHGFAAGQACRADLEATAKALDGAAVQGVWADYWDAYRLGLFMNERLPFAPFGGVDRHPAWTEAVRRSSPVAYLLDERAPIAVREALARLASPPRRVGRFDLYTLPRSLPDPSPR
jgi:hypothetical protein